MSLVVGVIWSQTKIWGLVVQTSISAALFYFFRRNLPSDVFFMMETRAVCRICLNVPFDNDVSDIDMVVRGMLQYILPNFDMDINICSKICKSCSRCLVTLHAFKSIIIERINEFQKFSKSEVKVENSNQTLVFDSAFKTTPQDCFICQTGLVDTMFDQFSEKNIVLLKLLEWKCVPELSSCQNSNLLICSLCQVNLQEYLNFTESCKYAWDKINLLFSTMDRDNPVTLPKEQRARDAEIQLEHSLAQQEKSEEIIKNEHDTNEIFLEEVRTELILSQEPIEIMKEESDIKKCPQCDFVTAYEGNLEAHLLVHKAEVFKCRDCNYRTPLKSCMLRHLPVHSDVRRYKCSKCDYSAKRLSGLDNHKLVHIDPKLTKMYKCDICTFESKRKSGLDIHMNQHKTSEEIQWFACECGYRTKRKSYLKKHRLIHLPSSDLAAHVCERCSSVFKNSKCLKQHRCKFAEA